ncbi:unnamed protein product [Rotaria sp. Silwood2]|nr:unnamed protein product [Rotaria sp. Silwood2]CAF4010619.1 unnamed protein product [Rotaria sp. Silwood2]
MSHIILYLFNILFLYNNLETGMETAIERFVSTNTKCYACGALVYAVEKKKTTNNIYHNRCFRCRICKRSLTESSLNEEGNDIYCSNCYRKKQRGDCNSLDFRRAASEREYKIYNNHDSDQQKSIGNSRPPIRYIFSRHPSLTLRQLERQFLSYQGPNINNYEIINGISEKPVSTSNFRTMKTSFSTPANFIAFRRSSLLGKDQRTPSLHFSPVFSPIIESPTKSNNITPKLSPKFYKTKANNEKAKQLSKSTDNILSELKNIRLNSSNVPLPSIERKHSIVIDVRQDDENNKEKHNIFRFPSTTITPVRRRSKSTSYALNRRKTK